MHCIKLLGDKLSSRNFDSQLESKKVIKKLDVSVGKKSILSISFGGAIVRLKEKGLFDLSQPIAIEMRGGAEIISPKKEK